MDVWDEFPTVYHYTRREGLVGILETQSLHATHYAFLNDSAETRLLHIKLVEHLLPYVQKAITHASQHSSSVNKKIIELGGLRAAALIETEKICTGFHKVTFDRTSFFEPFIISFCSHPDAYEAQHGLLSQWRAYGGDAGYAIAFDTEKLAGFVGEETQKFAYQSAQLGSVVYDGDGSAFEAEFDQLLAALPGAFPKDFYSTAREQNYERLFGVFTSSVTRFKHRGFREENEVRAVLSPLSQHWLAHLAMEQPLDYEKVQDKAVKPIAYKQSMIPYIAVGSTHRNLPIKFILVGPGGQQERRRQELQKFLRLKGLDIEISISETPLK